MALLGSLTACAGHSPNQSASVNNSVVGPYEAPISIANVAYDLYRDWNYKLDDVQKSKQTHAVYAALESEYGVEYKWYHGNAMGVVKAVHGYPQGSGFCKVIYSTVMKNNKMRNFKDTACRHEAREGWHFVM